MEQCCLSALHFSWLFSLSPTNAEGPEVWKSSPFFRATPSQILYTFKLRAFHFWTYTGCVLLGLKHTAVQQKQSDKRSTADSWDISHEEAAPELICAPNPASSAPIPGSPRVVRFPFRNTTLSVRPPCSLSRPSVSERRTQCAAIYVRAVPRTDGTAGPIRTSRHIEVVKSKPKWEAQSRPRLDYVIRNSWSLAGGKKKKVKNVERRSY